MATTPEDRSLSRPRRGVPRTIRSTPRSRGRQLAIVPSAILLAALALGAGLRSQSTAHGFDALPERGGTVHDADGQPIVGAEVSVVALDREGRELLASQPIPKLRTARDGSFRLPLTPSHRRIRTGGSLALRISAPDLQPWCEPLPLGLAGFIGTKATLRPWRDDERFTVTVRAPRPGDLLWLQRRDCEDDPLHRQGELLEVPATGRLTVFASRLPQPVVQSGWRQARATGHHLTLLSPGRCETVTLDATQREVAIGADSTEGASNPWPPEARGLFELTDGTLLSLPLAHPLAFDPRHPPVLRLLAAQAPGCAASLTGGGDVPLPPRPLPAAGVRLTLPTNLPGLRVFSLDLDTWFGLRHGVRRKDWRELSVGAELQLDAQQLFDRALLVEADGCAPRVYGPGELAAAPITLTREATGDLRVRVRDAAAAAVEAELHVPREASLRWPNRPTRTDANGVVRVTGLRAGQHRIEVLSEFGCAAAIATITPGQTCELTLTLEPRVLRAILRQPTGERAALVGVVIDELADDGLRTRRYANTDTLGRLLLTHLGQDVTLHCGSQRFADLDLSERASISDCEVSAARHVLVGLPPHTMVRAALFTDAAGRTRNQSLGLTTSAMWLTWPDDAARCDLLLGEGPPASVRREELAAPVTELARDGAPTRVALSLVCDDGQLPAVVRAHTPKTSTELLVVDTHEGDALVRDGAQLFCARRDPGAARVQLLSPDYLPSAILTLPAGVPQQPVACELRRGARVTLRFPPEVAPATTGSVELTIVDGGQPRAQVTLAAPARNPGQPWRVTLPFALPPGEYGFELSLGSHHLRVPCSVVGTTGCEVTVGA